MELSCNGTKECEIWMLINLDAFENVVNFSSFFVVVVFVLVSWSFFASTKGHFTMGKKVSLILLPNCCNDCFICHLLYQLAFLQIKEILVP